MRIFIAAFARGSRILGGFTANTALVAVATVILTPATIRAAGLDKWSSIVLAQAFALIVQAVAGCGYSVNGPSTVATQDLDQGVHYFFVAQRTRALTSIPCFAAMIGLMLLIPNPDPLVGLVGSAYLAIGTFSPLFFFIGRAAPLWLLMTDTLPKVASMLAGAACLNAGVPLFVGLALPAVGALLAVAISSISIRLSVRNSEVTGQRHKPNLNVEIRHQRSAMAVSLLHAGRDALPVLVVTVAALNLVGIFGVYDRIQRQASVASAPVISTMQGWVPRRMASQSSVNPVAVALVIGFAAALIFLILLILTGTPIVRWLSAETVTPTLTEICTFSGIIAASFLIHVIGYACLVPLDGVKFVAISNATGMALIALLVPIALSLDYTILSILIALASSCAVQLSLQLMFVRKAILKWRNSSSHSD